MDNFEFWDSDFPIEEDRQVTKGEVYKFTSKITGKTVEIPLLEDDIIVDGELRRIVRDETGEIPEWAKPCYRDNDYVRLCPNGTYYTRLCNRGTISRGRLLITNGRSNKGVSIRKCLVWTYLNTGSDQRLIFKPVITDLFDITNTEHRLEIKKEKRLICGIGITCNDDLRQNNREAYEKWRNILFRTTDTFILRNGSYSGCTIDNRWIYAESFISWYNINIYRIINNTSCRCSIEVDKDILNKGNKIYGPDTVLLVPWYINKYFVSYNASGVSRIPDKYHKKKRYIVQAAEFMGTRSKFLGCFYSYEEAHKTWAEFKTRQLHEVVLPYFINDIVEEDRNNQMVLKIIEVLKNYTFE